MDRWSVVRKPAKTPLLILRGVFLNAYSASGMDGKSGGHLDEVNGKWNFENCRHVCKKWSFGDAGLLHLHKLFRIRRVV